MLQDSREQAIRGSIEGEEDSLHERARAEGADASDGGDHSLRASYASTGRDFDIFCSRNFCSQLDCCCASTYNFVSDKPLSRKSLREPFSYNVIYIFVFIISCLSYSSTDVASLIFERVGGSTSNY